MKEKKEPHCPAERADPENRGSERARRRGDGRVRDRGGDLIRRPRGDRQLRRHRLAASAPALRHRSGQLSASGGSQCRARSSRSRLAICRTISISTPYRNARAIIPTIVSRNRIARCGRGCSISCSRPDRSTSTLFETGGFWYADKQARSPDIQFHLGLGSGIEAGVAAMQNPGVTLNSAFLRPRSRGTVRIASADAKAAPLIDPNYWADPYDRECAIKGLRLAREILRQPALKPFVMAERLPGDGLNTTKSLRHTPSILQDRPPSGGHVRDGNRRRGCGDAGSQAAGAVRHSHCRCFRHALRTVEQHECSDHYGCGEGVRYDSRQAASRASEALSEV